MNKPAASSSVAVVSPPAPEPWRGPELPQQAARDHAWNALLAEATGDYAEAARLYREVLSAAGDHGVLLAKAGFAALASGDSAQAEAMFGRAIDKLAIDDKLALTIGAFEGVGVGGWAGDGHHLIAQRATAGPRWPMLVDIASTVATQHDGKLSWSADHRLIAIFGWAKEVAVQDVPSGITIATLRDFGHRPVRGTFMPDGRAVAVVLKNGTIELRTIADGKSVWKVSHPSKLLPVVMFSSDGQRLLAAAPPRAYTPPRQWVGPPPPREDEPWLAKTWDVRTAKPGSEIKHAGRVTAWAMSESCELLVVGFANGDLKLHEMQRLDVERPLGRERWEVRQLLFSPDERHLIVLRGDADIAVYDLPEGRKRHAFTAGEKVSRLRVSRDGKTLMRVDRSEGWSVLRGEPLKPQVPWGMRWAKSSPDGRLWAASIESGLKVVEAESGKEVLRVGRGDRPIVGVALARDGDMLATVNDEHVVAVWRLRGTASLMTLDTGGAKVDELAISDKHGALLGVADTKLLIWDLASGALRHELTADKRYITGLALSPKGSPAVTRGGDGEVRFWDIEHGRELRKLTGWRGVSRPLAFSPDGRRLLIGMGMYSRPDNSKDDTIALLDVASGRVVKRYATGSASEAAFMPDGRSFVTWCPHSESQHSDGVLCRFDVRTGKVAARSPDDVGGDLRRLWVTPDGKTVIDIRKYIAGGLEYRFSSGADLSVLGSPESELSGDHGTLFELPGAMSGDGKWLAIGNDDGSVLLQRIADRRPQLIVRPVSDRSGFALAENSRVELIGPRPARRWGMEPLRCAIGKRSFPFELCAKRMLEVGLIGRMLK